MPQVTDTQLSNILSLVQEIKSMVSAERRASELQGIENRLDDLSQQHQNIREDIREVIMMIAQTQTAAD